MKRDQRLVRSANRQPVRSELFPQLENSRCTSHSKLPEQKCQELDKLHVQLDEETIATDDLGQAFRAASTAGARIKVQPTYGQEARHGRQAGGTRLRVGIHVALVRPQPLSRGAVGHTDHPVREGGEDLVNGAHDGAETARVAAREGKESIRATVSTGARVAEAEDKGKRVAGGVVTEKEWSRCGVAGQRLVRKRANNALPQSSVSDGRGERACGDVVQRVSVVG